MKKILPKRLLALILCLCVSSPSWASWTFVNSGGSGTAGSGATATFTIASVHVGDTVAIGVKWEGGDTTISCSDTASTFADAFVGAHVTDASAASHTTCYTLSSATSGTVTYTVTWGAARTFRDIGGMAYTPSGTASLDGTPHIAAGNGATANSGNMTTTGTDGISFGTFGETGATPTTATAAINAVTRDQVKTYGTAVHSCIWSKSYSAGFTGAATVPIGSGDFGCSVISFKTSGAAAASSGYSKQKRLERDE